MLFFFSKFEDENAKRLKKIAHLPDEGVDVTKRPNSLPMESGFFGCNGSNVYFSSCKSSIPILPDACF